MADAVVKRTRKQWKDSNMEDALKAVEEKSLTVSQAASTYNVPRKTLDDRVKGKVVHGTKPGRSTILSSEEEEALCNYLLYVAERGFPLTRRMVMAFAWDMAKRNGKAHLLNPELGPGMRWWINFRKRHPDITLRRVDKLDRSRAQCLDPEVVKDYFTLLKKTLTDNSLMNSPRCIYNCDESFLPLDGTREKAVTSKKAKSAYLQAQGSTEHITLLCGASAAGLALPPMIIFPKAFPGGAYTFKGPDDAVYAKSESGWVDSELFVEWMKKVFLKFATPQRPVLLIIDGHKTHLTLDVVDLAQSNGVILLCLPPHTTHSLQPLDVSVFKSLKDHFYRSVRAFCFVKKNFTVSKREFASVVKEPFEKSFSMSTIKSGFAKSGIFPFNPDAIDKSKMKPSECYRCTADDLSEGTSSDDHDTSQESSILAPDTLSLDSSANAEGTVTLPFSDCSSSAPSGTTVAESPTPLTVTPPQERSATYSRPTPLFATPPHQDRSSIVSANSTPCTSTPAAAKNPLVAAGLVPSHLADLFCTPESDVQKKQKRRRITNARVVTENEYIEMLKEKDKKDRETEEAKQRRKEEREEKKKERERLKKQRADERAKKKEKREQEKRAKGKQKGMRRRKTVSLPSSEVVEDSNQESEQEIDTSKQQIPEQSGPQASQELEESSNSESDNEGCAPRAKRRRQLPSRYQNTSSSESESEDGVLCAICKAREPPPPGCSSSIIFWIDCDNCDEWFHCFCALGSNTSSRKYLCSKCA